MLEEECCNLNRIALVYNLDTPSTKCEVFHDFTRMVKGSTLTLDILSGETGPGSLSEWVSFRMVPYVRSFDMPKCYLQGKTAGDFMYASLNICFEDIVNLKKPQSFLKTPAALGTLWQA